MRISDWSSDVCSSDLGESALLGDGAAADPQRGDEGDPVGVVTCMQHLYAARRRTSGCGSRSGSTGAPRSPAAPVLGISSTAPGRLEERSIGKGCVSKCKMRWGPSHVKKTKSNK